MTVSDLTPKPTRTRQRAKRQAKRAWAVNLFRVLSCSQLVLGFLLIFFGSYSVRYHTLHIETDIPYYTGAFITGPLILVFSLCGGIVFYKGDKAKTELRAMTQVKISMIVYIVFCPIATAASIVGVVLTATYGLCVQDGLCSYTVNHNFNLGMAILLLVLETLSLTTCMCSLAMIWKYAKLLGVSFRQNGSDVTKIRPGAFEMAAVHESTEDIAMKKWQDKVEQDVNVGKVMEYIEESRKSALVVERASKTPEKTPEKEIKENIKVIDIQNETNSTSET